MLAHMKVNKSQSNSAKGDIVRLLSIPCVMNKIDKSCQIKSHVMLLPPPWSWSNRK